MLGATLTAYERLAGELAPVAPQLGGAIGGDAITFAALASQRPALAAAIDEAAPAERATAVAFTRVDPALNGLARLAVALGPGGALLPGTVDALDRTLVAGAPALALVPPFAGRLHGALSSLAGLARDHAADRALVKLGDLVGSTNQVLSALVPAQLYCNVLAPWGQYFGSMWGGLGVGQGPSLANLLITSGGASGEVFQNARPSSNLGIDPLPYENAQQCQAGNEPWTGHQVLNNPPGILSRKTRTTVPPPGVAALAARAGLLAPIEGLR
jgi:hypothetical protein